VGGKGFTCTLSRGFNGKVLNWDLTFAQKARGQHGELISIAQFLRIVQGGASVWFVDYIGGGWEKRFVVCMKRQMSNGNYEV